MTPLDCADDSVVVSFATSFSVVAVTSVELSSVVEAVAVSISVVFASSPLVVVSCGTSVAIS